MDIGNHKNTSDYEMNNFSSHNHKEFHVMSKINIEINN